MRSLLLLTAVAGWASFAVTTTGLEATVYSDAELRDVYAVYSALLREHKTGWGWEKCAVQREAEVENIEVEGVRPLKHKGRYKEETEDFLGRTRRSFSLSPRFDPDVACFVIPEAEVREEILKSNTPPPPPTPGQVVPAAPRPAPRFRHIFTFSVVGFNRDRSRAVVYIGHHCGMLCGAGTFAALMKGQGQWRIDLKYKPSSSWVS